MSSKIRIVSGKNSFSAELFSSKSPETFSAIVKALPFSSDARTWGDEIYFEIPIAAVDENSTSNLEVGDIAFWPQGNCLCIFFGKTPASSSDKPAPASPVNIVGRLLQADSETIDSLRSIKDSDKIKVEVIK